MHACGHDIHMTSSVQPRCLLNEESLERHTRDVGPTRGGDRRRRRWMLRDNLYANFPKPDFAIALHDKPELETGKVGYTPCDGECDVDRRKSEASAVTGRPPENTKDPVVVAAQFVLALQTIVSRENSPLELRGYSRLDSRRHSLQHHSR